MDGTSSNVYGNWGTSAVQRGDIFIFHEGVWWDEMYYNIVLRVHALLKERLKMTSEVYEHRHFDRTH